MSSFKDAINKLISADNIYAVHTPLKTSRMGCNTPLEKLLQTFSPSALKYLEKKKEKLVDVNGYKFVENMSPSSISLSLMTTQYSSNNNDLFGTTSQFQSKNITHFYPGSMLVGHSEHMSCPSVLESYLDMNEHNKDEVYPANYDGEEYHDEIINSSHQGTWPQVNPLSSNNILPPVMLSNYEDMAMLQQELQAANGIQQYVLPIFFQPLMVADNEKSKKRERKGIPHKSQYVHDGGTGQITVDGVDQKVSDKIVNMPLPTNWFSDIHPSDEELLDRCKIALEPKKSPAPKKMTNLSIKYLEEAALRLLQGNDCKVDTGNKSNLSAKYECNRCHRTFRRQYTLDTHARIHTGRETFQM